MNGRLLIAGAACLWGMWSLCFRTAEKMAPGLSAATESFVVFAVMLVVVWPLSWMDRGQGRTRRQWALLFGLGVSDALNCLTFFMAMQKTTVAIAVLTHYLTPLLVALLAPMILGERWRARTFGALGLALTGLVLLLQPWANSTSGDLEGAAYGAASAAFYALNVFLGKGLGARFTPMEMSAWPRFSSVIVLGAALPAGGLDLGWSPLLVLVGGGLVFGALPLVMFYRGLASVPASQASVLTLCEPLVAVIVGAAVWDEVPGPAALVGAGLVLAGAAVIATTPHAADPGSKSPPE